MCFRVALVGIDVSEEYISTNQEHVTFCSLIVFTLNMRLYVPPKRQFLQEPHGDTSQKTIFFIVTAVKTSILYRRCDDQKRTKTVQFPFICQSKLASRWLQTRIGLEPVISALPTSANWWLCLSPHNGCHDWIWNSAYWSRCLGLNWFPFVRFEVFHGGDYEECRLLGCYAVWLL
jgi:hypothetical protein